MTSYSRCAKYELSVDWSIVLLRETRKKITKVFGDFDKHVYRLQLLTDNVAIIGILRALVLSADRKPETDF